MPSKVTHRRRGSSLLLLLALLVGLVLPVIKHAPIAAESTRPASISEADSRIAVTPASAGEDDLALSLNGTDQYASADSATNLGLRSEYTIEAWFAYGDGATCSPCVILERTNDYYISLENGVVKATAWSAQFGKTLTSPALSSGSWNHIALTRSDRALSLYLNGQQVNTATLSTSDPSSSPYNYFFIGASCVGDGTSQCTSAHRHFLGQIDEVRYFGDARTNEEIVYDMHNYGPTNTDNLIAYYDFNDGSDGAVATSITNASTNTTVGPNLTTIGSPVHDDITTVVTNDSRTIVTFPRSYLTAAGGWRVPADASSADALVVGGGGGGGSYGGGGGGGGGIATWSGNAPITAGAIAVVTVGQGGVGGVTGTPTTFPRRAGQPSRLGSGLLVGGGGAGGNSSNNTVDRNGMNAAGYTGTSSGVAGSCDAAYIACGSGGGSSFGGWSSGPQVGHGLTSGGGSVNNVGGGGGGSVAAGVAGTTSAGGPGGNGATHSISGSAVVYGSGGGGGHLSSPPPPAAAAGDGAGRGGTWGSAAGSGTANRGGGGGGGSDNGTDRFAYQAGGNGGSGVIIVSYTGAPGPPAAPTAIGSNPNEITVSWAAPTQPGTSAITGYSVLMSVNGGAYAAPASGPCSTASTSVSTVTSCVITDATAGSTYEFTVAAINDSGTGAASSPSTSVTAHGPLSAFNVTATGGGVIGTQIAGQPFAIEVAAVDAGGNTVSSFTGTVDITSSNASISVGGGTTSPFVAGVLSAHPVTVTAAGTGRVVTATRTAGGTEAGTSTGFTVTAGAPSGLAITTEPEGGAPGGALRVQPIVTISDAYGNTVATSAATVTVSIASGPSGTLSGTTTINASSGVVTFTDLSFDGDQGADYTLEFASTGLVSATSASFDINLYRDSSTDGGGWLLVAYGDSAQLGGDLNSSSGVYDPTTRTGKATFDARDMFRAADEVAISWNRPGSGFPTGDITSYDHAVSWTLPTPSAMTLTGQSGTCTLNCTSDFSPVTITDLTGLSGLSSTQFMNSTTFGMAYSKSYGITDNAVNWGPDSQSRQALYLGNSAIPGDYPTGYFTTNGTTAGYVPETVAVWVRSLTANELRVATTAAGAASGSVLTTQPAVTITNSVGALLTSDNSAVVTADISPGATLSGTLSVTAVNGTATFTDLVATGPVGPYTLTFSSGSLTAADQPIVITAGTATDLTISTPAGDTPYGADFPTQPSVAIVDSAGNTVAGWSTVVTATVKDGDGNTIETATVTPSSGEATFAGLGSDSPVGTLTIEYSSGALTIASQVVTVTKAAQSPLVVTSTAGTYDTPIALAATGGSTGGAVTYAADDGTASGCTVSVGQLTSDTAGTCLVTATMAGDGNYDPVTSASTVVTIAKASQTITFAPSFPATTFGDDPVAITGSTTSNLVLTFSTSTPNVCSVEGDASTVANTSFAVLTPIGAGTCTISADQPGDERFSAATSVRRSFTIAKGSQAALTFTSSSSGVWGDELTVAVTGGSGSGAVSFNATPETAGCSVDATTGVVRYTSAGSCTITADKAGDTNHLAAVRVAQTLTIAKAAQSLTFTSIVPVEPLPGGSYDVNVAATSGLIPMVSIAEGETSVCTMSDGVVTFVATGRCTISATQDGDGRFNAATGQTQVIEVGALNQSISVTVPDDVEFGSPGFSLGAEASSGLAVAVSATDNDVCTVVESIVTPADIGVCNLTLTQAGDSRYAAASPVTISFRVVPARPSAPSIMSVSAGNASVTVGFTIPGFTGGVSLGGYTITATPTEGIAIIDSACTESPCTITGLTNGTTYTVSVMATNAAGNGPASTPSPEVTPATSAAAVTTMSALPADGTLSVFWAAPSSFGGGTFTRYELRITPEGAAMPSAATTVLSSPDDDSHTFTGLDNGTAYMVEIVTITSANQTAIRGNTAMLVSVPVTTPSAPTGLAVNVVSPRVVHISWAGPIRDGGAPVTEYTVSIVTPNRTPVECGTVTISPESKSGVCVSGLLTLSTTYTVAVAAVNRIGAGTAASVAHTTPTFAAPTSQAITIANSASCPCLFEFDGAPVPVDVNRTLTGRTPGEVTVTTGPTSITLGGAGSGSSTSDSAMGDATVWTDPTGLLTIQTPGSLPLNGSGALPGTTVVIFLDGVSVGTATVGDSGTWMFDLEAPIGTAGAVDLALVWIGSDGNQFTLITPIRVLASGEDATSPRAPLGDSQVETDPDSAIAIGPNNELLEVTRRTDPTTNSVIIASGETTLTVTPTMNGRLDSTGRLILTHPAKIRVTGDKMLPDAIATGWIMSIPQRLGTGIIGADGTIDTTFSVPLNLEPGNHTLQFDTVDASGQPLSIALGMTISEDALPATGSDTHLAWLTLLLAVGALTTLTAQGSRRRSQC